MFTDSYTQIEDGDAAKILDDLNPLLEGAKFDPAAARVLSHDLPFYKGYQLIEVSDYDVNPPRQVSFIYKADEKTKVRILDGRNEVIYDLNKIVPLEITSETATLYVRFFFSYVRGAHGQFIIVENVDDIDWREEPAPAGRKALAKMIQSLSIKEEPAENTYLIGASIIFKDSLFEADITIQPDGAVSLSNQELLVEDIPVLDGQFNQ